MPDQELTVECCGCGKRFPMRLANTMTPDPDSGPICPECCTPPSEVTPEDLAQGRAIASEIRGPWNSQKMRKIVTSGVIASALAEQRTQSEARITELEQELTVANRVLSAAGFSENAKSEGEYMNAIECGLAPNASRLIWKAEARVRVLEAALEAAGDQLALAGAADTAYEPALTIIRTALHPPVASDALREAVEYVSGAALCDSAPYDRMVARLLDHAIQTTHPVEGAAPDGKSGGGA